MPKSDIEIERALQSVIGSMAISGFTLDDEQIANGRAILKGEIDGEAHVQQLLQKYRVKNKVDNDNGEADS